MAAIHGIPTTRVSDIFIRERLLRQVQSDQGDLYRVQMQLATGRRFELPSQDAVAAMRVMDLQRLLERKAQVYTNVDTNQSFLTAADATLMSASNLLAEARATALGALGTTTTEVQRQTAVQQIDQIINQLLDTGNQQFRGRYLFAGSQAAQKPFAKTALSYVEYSGNESAIRSYCDIDMLFNTNVTGNEVFGVISETVQGTADVKPVLTQETRVIDLRGGDGISPGSIKIADGARSVVVDLSGAETIGDIARMLTANPPLGNEVQVELTPTQLRIRLASGDLSITEVAGGTTAHELGILTERGAGTEWVDSRDLDPILRETTRLDEAFGSYARAVVRSTGHDNDLIFTADEMGDALNGITIRFEDTAPIRGAETLTFDGSTLTIGIKLGESRAKEVIAKVTAEHDAGNIPFSVALDPLDAIRDGDALVAVSSAVTDYGSESQLDKSGLQIVNGGNTHTISLATAETFEDVLNIINGSGAGVLAEINADATGINIRSRLSGCDFAIGENGGDTAHRLGLRTFTVDSKLEDFNHGLGVHIAEGLVDFTIQRADGVTIDVDLDGAETVQDVLDRINVTPELQARLTPYGNGIELIDNSTGAEQLTVTRSIASTAAIELGLIPEGANEFGSQVTGATAQADLFPAGDDNDLTFSAALPGPYGNVRVVFADNADAAATFDYNSTNGVITFGMTTDVSGGLPLTTAGDLITMLGGDPVAGTLFTATLNTSVDPTNDGTGLVPPGEIELAGGGPSVLTGVDKNTSETEGVFNSLVRLRNALEHNDVLESQRAIDLLDASMEHLSFARADLGARQQALDTLQSRLDDEEIMLREAMSVEFDVDMVEVVSRLTAKQATFEASLRATASIFQMTLLNYL